MIFVPFIVVCVAAGKMPFWIGLGFIALRMLLKQNEALQRALARRP